MPVDLSLSPQPRRFLFLSEEEWRSFVLNVIAGLVGAALIAMFVPVFRVFKAHWGREPTPMASADSGPSWQGDTLKVRAREGEEVVVTFWMLDSSYRWKRGSETEIQRSGEKSVADIQPSLKTLIDHYLSTADAIVTVGTASQEFENRDLPVSELERRETRRAEGRANTLRGWTLELDTSRPSRPRYELVLGRWIGAAENHPSAEATAYQRRVILLGLRADRLTKIPVSSLEAALREGLARAQSTQALELESYGQFSLKRYN